MKLNRLLALSFGVIVFLAVGQGLYSIFHYDRNDDEFNNFFEDSFQVRTSLFDLDAAIDEIHDSITTNFARNTDTDPYEPLPDKIERLKKLAQDNIDSIRRQNKIEASKIDKIEDAFSQWMETIDGLNIDRDDLNHILIPASARATQYAVHLKLLREATNAFGKSITTRIGHIRTSREASTGIARTVTIVIVFAITIIGFLSTVVIVRRLRKLLGKDPTDLARIAVDVAAGEFHHKETCVEGSVHAQLMTIVKICEFFQQESQKIASDISKGNLYSRPSGGDQLQGGWHVMFHQVLVTFDFLTAYLNRLPSPLIIVDRDLQMVYANKAATELIDLLSTDSDLTAGTPPCRILCDHDCPCAAAIQDGKMHQVAACHAINGHRKHYKIIANPVIDINGELAGSVTIFTDVTEQTEAMEKLRRNEEVFKDAERIGRVGAWEWYFDQDGAILSEEACRIFGYKPGEEVRNEDFKKRVHPDDVEYYIGVLQEVIETGEERTYQYRYYHPDNRKLRHIEVRAGVGQRDENGCILSLRGVVADISELEIAKQELDKQNQFIMSVLDNMPIGVAVYRMEDPKPITYMNQDFIRLYGLNPDDLPETFYDFWPRAFPDETFRNELLARVQGDYGSGETSRRYWENIPITYPDGATSYVTAKSIPFFDESLVISVVWDVDTQYKALEEAMQSRREAESANEAKSIFLANMSHEIRTPLNVVLGFAQLLAENVSDAQRREYAHAIQAAGTALLELINDILEISKIEFSKMVIRPRPVSVSMVLDELHTIFFQTAKEKGLSFNTTVADDIPVLMLDGPRLRQILINLAGNAIKFTEQGSIGIHANASTEDGKCCLDITVADTGVGIPDDQAERVFNLFEQQESQDISRYGGTGLGLAISKHIADLMGGSISLDSTPGKGSTFTLHLPNIPLADDVQLQPEVETSEIPTSFKPVNALVVDDIASNRIVLAAMLHTLGLQVETAENGAEALTMTETIVPDIILTDQRMPVMDGKEFARQVRNRPDLRHIPVIAVTATHELESVEASELFSDVLPKPINRVSLIHLLTKYIEPIEQGKETEDDSQ